MPSISVVMPVREEARHVGEAIDSILAQSWPDFELIAVDDGSTEDTARILDAYAGRDARVKVLRNDRPLGIAAALNRGIQASRAPLIARMDADDVSAPERLERQKLFLDTHPHVVLCGSGTRLIDQRGRVVDTCAVATGDATLRAMLPRANAFRHGTVMFRRREAENAGLYSADPAWWCAEDYEFCVRIAARHEIDNLPDILYSSRVGHKRQAADLGARQAASSAAVGTLAAELLSGRGHRFDVPVGHAPARPGRIFVIIATYADRDCQWTIQDLFARARRPDDITVGVCWQYDPRRDRDCFHLRTRPHQVRSLHVHVNETRGLGWARHMSERLWQGEEYVLQIDGHMRFAEAWDERLLDELAACNSRFPVLTVYPWGFVPPRALYEGPPLRMAALRFHDSGMPGFVASLADGAKRPVMHAFWAGGFAFSRADVLREVPQDPHLYFTETEPTHGARLWTHGWDLFGPSENLIWHCYGPDKAANTRSHWTDNADWGRQVTRSVQRALHLLSVRPADDPEATVDLPRFGMGTYRTLADYQQFAGIDFSSRSIAESARQGVCAPEYARPRFD